MEGGAAVQVTNKDSSDPSVSPEGKLIARTYKGDNAPFELAVVKFEGGTPVRLFDVPSLASFATIRWTTDGKAVTYRDRDRGVVLQLLNGEQPNRLKVGSPRRL
jgi:Tol biopolymer transport system component